MSTETVNRKELIEYTVSRLRERYSRLSVGILKTTMYATFIGVFCHQSDPTMVTADHLVLLASTGAVIGSMVAIYGLSRVKHWSSLA